MKVGRTMAVAFAMLAVAACSGRKPDQYRSVTSYEFASCDSRPTADAVELEALGRFRQHALAHWFHDDGKALTLALHERKGTESGLREYGGDPYWYLHVLPLEREDRAAHVEWKAMAYLHAREVRTRLNGGDWSEWQRVRTRNFGVSSGRGVEGIGRWACLQGAEIAWAEVRRVRVGERLEWEVQPLAVGPYAEDELKRAEPQPTPGQIANDASVPAGAP